MSMSIGRVQWRKDYGGTIHNLYLSHYVLMTLESNTFLATNTRRAPIKSAEYALQVLVRLGGGKKYLGMDIYKRRAVHVSMVEYVPFQHNKTSWTPQHQPYRHVKPTYGATRQYA